MKTRMALLLILFALLQILLYGCTPEEMRNILPVQPALNQADNPQEPAEPAKVPSETAEPIPDKPGTSTSPAEKPILPEPAKPDSSGSSDMGVVTGTVVDVRREPDAGSERVTQALFNQPVKVMEERPGWFRVKVVDGYTGWIKSENVSRDCSSINAGNFRHRVIVTAGMKKIYTQPQDGTVIRDVVMGTELYAMDKTGSRYKVALPGGKIGWIDEAGTIRIGTDAHIPKTTADAFVQTAEKFMGVPYLWGGVSSLGIDCSGLTYICSRINGVDLPRDAEPQFQSAVGQKVDASGLKRGDLLFFSSGEDLKGVSHVAIYLGDNKFIHASKSAGKVTTGLLTGEYFSKRLVGVKRIF